MSAQRTYSYRARDAEGGIVTGTLVADSEDEVGARLRDDGKYVLRVTDTPLRVSNDLDEARIRRTETARRVRREDVIIFCQQLAVMLDTGVPLAEALDSFMQQSPRREFLVVLSAISDDIHAGEPLSTAMSRWPRVFPSLMISLMKASETSGTMGMMLGQVAEYLGKERRTARQVKGALSYPMFMLGAGTLMTVFLMVVVLPRFATIYAQRSASLPTPTRVLLGISDFLATQYLYYGPVVVVLFLALQLWSHTAGGRRAVDWLKLNTPILKTMYRQLYITRATRTMGTLLSAGVNLIDIIEICRGVTNNAYYDELWEHMESEIRDGRQISDAIVKSRYIPPNVAAMIGSGERSGRLSEVMDKIATFSEDELDAAVKQVTAYIEPVAIVCMGIVVGGIAVALLLPIFSMGRVVAGS